MAASEAGGSAALPGGAKAGGGSTVSLWVAAAIVVADMVGVGVFTSLGFQVKDIPNGFSILLLIVVLLYSGELISKERSLRLHLIQDALPAPGGVFFFAKLAALLLAIAASFPKPVKMFQLNPIEPL